MGSGEVWFSSGLWQIVVRYGSVQAMECEGEEVVEIAGRIKEGMEEWRDDVGRERPPEEEDDEVAVEVMGTVRDMGETIFSLVAVQRKRKVHVWAD